MAKINLRCEQCGGNIILDDSHEFGTCEYCYAQFLIKKDEIVQKITQNITKYVYGYKGKDVEELLTDAYKLIDLGDDIGANSKFRQAMDIEPDCWSAWLGYAATGGDRSRYLSIVSAYRSAYNAAQEERQELDTFISMVQFLPDTHLRSAFIRAFNMALPEMRSNIFGHVSGVIGCDESEMAALAVALCPEDWRANFAMAKFRQIRARWCELEGNFLTGKRLPAPAAEVLELFMRAYRFAKAENEEAEQTVRFYIEAMKKDTSYKVLAAKLNEQIGKVN